MQLPLPEHTCAQRCESGETSAPRMMSSTPPVTRFGSRPASPAGAVMGHTSKQRPQAVQLSSTCCARVWSPSAKVSLMLSL